VRCHARRRCAAGRVRRRVEARGGGGGGGEQRACASPPEPTTLPKVDTNCTAPSLIPTVNGNTVRSFSTHGHQSAAKGSATTVSRSDIRSIQHLDSSALWSDGPEVALNWLFPYPILPTGLTGGGPTAAVQTSSTALYLWEKVDWVGSHGRWKRPCLQAAHMTI
jgi:hypothetical protein